LGSSVFEANALESPALARVKVNLLPVYAEVSVTSGIVRFLKKGDVVRVQSETVDSGEKWCSITEAGKTTRLGFVFCEALEYSEQQRPSVEPQERKHPPAPLPPKETQPLPRQAALPSPKITQHPPRLGEFLGALWQGDILAVRDMLDKGADPNAQTACGTRPLLIVAKMKNPEVMKLLINHGAHLDGRDKLGLTPLMAAASMGHTKNAQVLIESGADLNARDNNGLTALMWATAKGFPEMVEILLANGADVNAKTKEGLTASRFSSRIIADMKRSLADAEAAGNKGVLSRLEKELPKHEQVLLILEEAGGK